MNITVYQSLSLAAQTAAFGVLDYSDRLNDLASRITGGRVNRNVLAESILHNATDLALDIASKNKSVNKFAEDRAGITGAQLTKHVGVILLGKKDDAVSSPANIESATSTGQRTAVPLATSDDDFSRNVDELLDKVLTCQIGKGNISSDDYHHAHNLIRSLINDHLGKQAIRQFLGTYVQNQNWDRLRNSIQSAVVQDNNFSYKNLLIMAGVRAASGIAHSLITRGIVENPSFDATDTNPDAGEVRLEAVGTQTKTGELKPQATGVRPENAEAKPAIRLAAACLDAYLKDEFNCAEVLKTYTPSKGLLNDELIGNVAALAPTLTKRMVKNAKSAVTKAEETLTAENGKFELEKHESRDPSMRNASNKDNDPAAEEFELTKPSALEKAEKRLKSAQKYLKRTEQMQEMSSALKDLLVSDPKKKNNERIALAFDTLLTGFLGKNSSIPDWVPTTLTGKVLEGGKGLPVQHILGTFIAKYNWDNLENLLEKAVEKYLDDLHELYAKERVEARDMGDHENVNKTISWAQENMLKFAVKLSIPHLKLYFGEKQEDMKFDRRGDPHYEMLADLLHANQDSLARLEFSRVNVIRNSARILTTYAANQTKAGVRNVSEQVTNNVQQLTDATTGYVTSAVEMGTTAVRTVQSVSEDIANNGIAGAVMGAGVATLGYAQRTANATVGVIGGWFGGLPGLPGLRTGAALPIEALRA